MRDTRSRAHRIRATDSEPNDAGEPDYLTTERRDRDDRPVRPKPEKVDGHNIAYRGQQFHGVHPERDVPPTNEDMYYDGQRPQEVPEPRERHAIPVRQIYYSPTEVIGSRARTFVIPLGSTIQILNHNPRRTRAIVARANGSNNDTFLVGPDPSVNLGPDGKTLLNTSNGFALGAIATLLETHCNDALYACSSIALGAITVYEEFATEQ